MPSRLLPSTNSDSIIIFFLEMTQNVHEGDVKEYSKEELKKAWVSKMMRRCKICQWILLFTLSLPLFSCSHSSGNFVRLKNGSSNAFSLNGSFKNDVFEIVDKNGTLLAPVTSDIVKGFSTQQSQFDTDFSATAVYQGESLPFTYQISSSYEDSEHKDQMVFHNEGTIELTFFGKPDSSLSTFSIPENLTYLPAPLKEWPITSLAASFGGFSSTLQKVCLNPSLVSFKPLASENLSSLEFIPSSTGKLHYDERGFLMIDSALWGIEESLQGAVSLPSDATSVKENAFAGVLSGITSLSIDKNYDNPNFTLTSCHLPANQAFVIKENGNGYSSQDGFILYRSGSDVICRGVPAGKIGEEKTLTLPEGINRFLLDVFYGFENPTMEKVVLPSSVTSFKDGLSELKNTTLHTLRFTSPSVVSTNSISVTNLPASLTTIEVPSALLSSYQNAAGWSLVKERLVAY